MVRGAWVRGRLLEGRIVIDARFGHVNVIARDWRRLADFYTRVLGCEFVPPERDYSGPDLAAGTGVPDAALRGAHLRLPGLGLGETGPTLEIYQYTDEPEAPPPAVNRPGFGPHRVRGPGRRRGPSGGPRGGRRGRSERS